MSSYIQVIGTQRHGPGGKLALTMPILKFSRVKLLEGTWHTAPNHSRPASCVIEADIDADDHPAGDPQKGQ